MCTSINYLNGDHYFGRNLDLEIDFPVDVVITPRNYTFNFRHLPPLEKHNAMIGMALIENDYPLYFEAINDVGLGMAGLAFHDYAEYYPVKDGKTNLASFEIIQYILGKCSTVEEAKKELENINITNEDFDQKTPHSPLHWMIGDKNESIVVECTENGMTVYDNPYGVLTNSPTFEFQETNLSFYMNVTKERPVNRFDPSGVGFKRFSAGMGSAGLPGGVDSISRFVRVAFCKLNSVCEATEAQNVAQYFHLLGVVQQVSGEDEVEPDVYEVTQYSSCGNTDKGIFYYSTYFNPNIVGIDMFKENLDAKDLKSFKVSKELKVPILNE